MQIINVNKEDSNFQYLETLKKNRTKRHQNNEFFVEGVRNVNEALRNGWEIISVAYSKQNKISDWARNILKESKVKRHYLLTESLLQKLSGKNDASELIITVKMKEDDLSRISEGKNPIIVIFDRPSNKGNLGAIIRSCDALFSSGLVVTGHSVDIYDPDTIIASMGSFFKIPIIRKPSFKDIASWISNMKSKFQELQVIGTSSHADIVITNVDYTKPTILLIGNETDGLSNNYKNICNSLVKIPIGGSASSINVSCATSIFLYEIIRQRSFVTPI